MMENRKLASSGVLSCDTMDVPRVPLRCQCCGLPFGYLQGNVIVIESRHHGTTHVNLIPLVNVPELRQEVRPDGQTIKSD